MPRGAATQRAEEMAALDRVIQSCLAKDPSERFESASELASALQDDDPDVARLLWHRALQLNPDNETVKGLLEALDAPG